MKEFEIPNQVKNAYTEFKAYYLMNTNDFEMTTNEDIKEENNEEE